MDFEAFKAEYRSKVESFLQSAFDNVAESEVSRVARYISLNGGHRWRALVFAAAGQIFDGNAHAIVLPAAAAVELSHSASLILDDLPSMDDAQVRRGRPCAHHVFARWAVDMAPVFLVTLAYDLALRNSLASPERRVSAAVALSQAGIAMISGQVDDLSSSRTDGSEEQLLRCYRLKSGALYAAAAVGGAILCGATEACAAKLQSAGMLLGLSYQYLDDVADATADSKIVGKDTQCDVDKLTAVSLFGVDGATSRSRDFQNQALEKLASFGREAEFLRRLVMQASWAPS